MVVIIIQIRPTRATTIVHQILHVKMGFTHDRNQSDHPPDILLYIKNAELKNELSLKNRSQKISFCSRPNLVQFATPLGSGI